MVTLPENECPAYFDNYLKLVSNDIGLELAQQLLSYMEFLQNIPQDKEL